MSVSTSHAAFEDCYALFNRAIESPKGIEVRFPTYGAAMHYRTRLHWSRTLTRRRSMEIYQPGDPDYGISAFDGISVGAPLERAEGWWLRLIRRVAPEEIREIQE